MDDFVEGEILVASKTQPSYVVVMNKAAAIITDMGELLRMLPLSRGIWNTLYSWDQECNPGFKEW